MELTGLLANKKGLSLSNQKPFNVSLEPLEAQQLIELLDAAVKALGLKAAGPATNLAVKIEQAYNLAQQEKAPTKNGN